MSVVTLHINDELVSARDDQKLLEVIREQGINIPTLCHMEGISALGGCRLCLVETKGSNKLLAACVTPVQEGMSVYTHSERLVNYRRITMELLLSERNHTCAVCVMNGHCELQFGAAELGVDHVRYEYMAPELPIDSSHSNFTLDHNRCLLCLRCVRVCDEVEGAHTLDVMGRGTKSRIITALNRPWGESISCTKCGKCVQVCPTGALIAKGSSVGEMEKRHSFLTWILNGRRNKEWQW